MYEGPMDRAKGGWDWGWDVGVGRVGGSGGGKMGTTVFKHQYIKESKKKEEERNMRLKK